MKTSKSIFSWTFSLWLSFALMLQSFHKIELLVQEICNNNTSHNKEANHHHHDDNCSICHFHISPTLLPSLISIDTLTFNSIQWIKDSYKEGHSTTKTFYLSLRAPPIA